MQELLKKLILGMLLLAGLRMANAQETPLRFGVFPNLSPRLLVETYQPLSDALSTRLKRPVELQTAPDFKTFFERTQAREYDLVLTAPHLAWLAYRERGYRPLFVYQRETEGILVIHADSGYKSPLELKGKTIMLADALAITVMRMESDLAKMGLAAGRDFTSLEVGSHNNAALHVVERRCDAAILGGLPFQRLPEAMRRNLRVIKATQSFPGQVYLVNPALSHDQEMAIRGALKGFMDSAEGKAFLAQGGFVGLRNMEGWELRQFEQDGKRLQQKLIAGREQVVK
jgi:phosphonate transport system substrate-binding protein